MKKYILLLIIPIILLSCNQNFYCSHCKSENVITKDSTIYLFKDSTLVIPYYYTIPRDSIIYQFYDTVVNGNAQSHVAHINVYKKGHIYTVVALCVEQKKTDSIIYNLKVRSTKELITIRDQTYVNQCAIYKQKLSKQRYEIIALILGLIIVIGIGGYIIIKTK